MYRNSRLAFQFRMEPYRGRSVGDVPSRDIHSCQDYQSHHDAVASNDEHSLDTLRLTTASLALHRRMHKLHLVSGWPLAWFCSRNHLLYPSKASFWRFPGTLCMSIVFGLLQVGLAQVGLAQVSPAQECPEQVGVAQIGSDTWIILPPLNPGCDILRRLILVLGIIKCKHFLSLMVLTLKRTCARSWRWSCWRCLLPQSGGSSLIGTWL
jgi:hypothetical protein